MRIIDLFCGAGGFSQGFKEAGHEIILAIDNWRPALKTHELNHPEAEHWLMDISKLEAQKLPPFDVIIGGPPCQAFSYMGKEQGEKDPRGSLTRDFIRLAKKAKFVLFENVPGIERFRIYQDVVDQLKLQSRKLNCADFGVPTIRKRIFASNFGFPEQTHSCYPFQKLLTNEKSRKWISAQDKLKIDDSNFLFFRRYTGGQNGIPIRSIQKPFFTVLSGTGNFYIMREILWQELVLLQGFSLDYKFSGGEEAIRKQIANAVPPPVARAFGTLLNGHQKRD